MSVLIRTRSNASTRVGEVTAESTGKLSTAIVIGVGIYAVWALLLGR